MKSIRSILLVAGTIVLGALFGAAHASAAAVVTQATGKSAADIKAQVDSFRSTLGQAIPAGSPPQAAGFRNIAWDAGIPQPGNGSELAGTNLVADPFFMPLGQFRGFGAVFTTPGRGTLLSNDPLSSGLAPKNFGSIDPSYSNTFTPFTNPRLFTTSGSNVIDLRFTIPGTDQNAQTSAFGAVMADVDVADSTTITYFAPNGKQLGTFAVPATNGVGTLSFLGVRFTEGEQVARVQVKQGTGALAQGVTDVSVGGTQDLVVADDFTFSEPQTIVEKAPKVTVIGKPATKTTKNWARFTWKSDTGKTFECRVLKRGSKNAREKWLAKWRSCKSGVKYRPLRVGTYVFEVRGYDASYNVSASKKFSWVVWKGKSGRRW